MADIGDLLNSSIPVDLEREVSNGDQSAQAEPSLPAPYLSRYSADKRSTAALLMMQSAEKRVQAGISIRISRR